MQLRHLLFAVILGVCIGGTALLRSRAPTIMIPLALAGLYVAAVTAAQDRQTAVVGIARGALLGSLSLASATMLLVIITLVSRYLPNLEILTPSRGAFLGVWSVGGLIIGFWFLLGVLLRVLNRR